MSDEIKPEKLVVRLRRESNETTNHTEPVFEPSACCGNNQIQ